jgi:hypothetical protein
MIAYFWKRSLIKEFLSKKPEITLTKRYRKDLEDLLLLLQKFIMK